MTTSRLAPWPEHHADAIADLYVAVATPRRTHRDDMRFVDGLDDGADILVVDVPCDVVNGLVPRTSSGSNARRMTARPAGPTRTSKSKACSRLLTCALSRLGTHRRSTRPHPERLGLCGTIAHR